MSAVTAFAAVAQSIVLITASVQGGTKTGTGFAITSTPSSTRILTADHVVEDSASPTVFIGGPRGQRYSATIIRADRLRDIALLEIPLGNFPTVTLSTANPPVSGTKVEVMGFPTALKSGPDPAASPSPLPLSEFHLVFIDGKVDGLSEQGESILLDMSITHGDSGAPIVDAGTNHVVGMVLGLAAGYGVARWMSGDGLGLSVAGISGFLGQVTPPAAPPKPSYSVAVVQNDNADVLASWPRLAASAGFLITNAGKPDPCRSTADGPPAANAIMEEEGDTTTLSIDVTDCSGASFYRDGMTSEQGGIHDLVRLVGRTFLGYVDTHPAEWASLLKDGIAVDAQKNPYLALMSVQRNPYRQLVVAHTFHGGPADRAGLSPGDAILKIDGRPSNSLGDPFIARLLNQPSVTLLVSRQEREFTVRLHLKRFSDVTANGPVPH